MQTLEGSTTVEAWLSRLRPSTYKSARHYFDKWYEWVGENSTKFGEYPPDQLIQYQKDSDNGSRYDILDEIQRWILSLNGRVKTKKTAYSYIRSYFLHNRAELPRDPSFNITGDKPKVRGTLTAEEIKQVVMSCNPVYQAVFLSMFQGGMGQEEFFYWNMNGWGKLKEDLKDDPDVLRIDLPGRKKAKFETPYYTLIGPDAIKAIRNWLQHRPDEAKAIFSDQHGSPTTKNGLNMYWRRHLKKLGLIPKKKGVSPSYRTGKNVHEIRDVFRSQWEKSPAKASVAEFLMGHNVDPLEYNKAFRDESWVRKEYYDKALPMLQIISSGRPFGRVDESEVDRLRRENEELRKRIDTLSRLEDSYDNLEKRIRELEKSNQ